MCWVLPAGYEMDSSGRVYYTGPRFPVEPIPMEPIPMKQVCPVCKGKGFVPAWFYHISPEVECFTWNTAGGSEPCRTCAGSGVI